MRRLSLLFICCFCGLLTRSAQSQNWPQFRGAQARGVSHEQNLPAKWDDSTNIRWKTPIPGRGWSSPIVWGSQVFLTTVINEGETEPAKKGLYFGGNREKPPQSPHHWEVHCLDLESGRTNWKRRVHSGVPTQSHHIKNSFASETPVTDGEHVYAFFGNLGLFCLKADGTPVWSKSFSPNPTRYAWGTAASPALHDGRLFVVNDNERDSYLIAIDKLTGEELWRVSRDKESNWSTPYVWQNDLRTEIVVPGTAKNRVYDLNGKQLYEFGGNSTITIATPYAAHGLLYVSSGYVLDKKKPVFAIRPGASGDISLGEGETENDFIAWCQKGAAPYNPTTIVYEDLLYVLLDRGFFACYDARSGKQVYGRQRLPNGRAFTSSPWAYNNKIFCLNEYGETFVIQAGPEFKILHVNSLNDEMCMATPAIANGNLLIRTAEHVYCVRDAGP